MLIDINRYHHLFIIDNAQMRVSLGHCPFSLVRVLY